MKYLERFIIFILLLVVVNSFNFVDVNAASNTIINVSMQDVDTKKELVGATLVLKDSNGNVVDTWVTTNEVRHFENLQVGQYTLIETNAPNGYELINETREFKVTNDETERLIVMYNYPSTSVPLTSMDASGIVIILGIISIIIGIGLVYKNVYTKN